MHGFFTGWRRKAGIGLLLIALLWMAAWVRSFCVADTLTLWNPMVTQVISGNGALSIARRGCQFFDFPAGNDFRS
jgi:hypothetical protein